MRRPTTAAVLAAALLGGCSATDPLADGKPKTVPAGGVVTYRGQPLAGASVAFFSPEANRTAIGKTDDAGRFTLTTFAPGDGAVVGPQRVTVRKFEVISKAKPGYDYVENGETAPLPEERWHTPKRYAQPDTSGLTATVAEDGPNDFTLELKD